MIKVEIDSVSMRGNTPVLVMELALAMKSLRESLAKRYGEVATEELISRAMEASKAEGDINEIMSDLIDDVLFKILPKANINKDNIREMPQALKEVLRKMLEDMIMHEEVTHGSISADHVNYMHNNNRFSFHRR